jgi:hypothetical protein
MTELAQGQTLQAVSIAEDRQALSRGRSFARVFRSCRRRLSLHRLANNPDGAVEFWRYDRQRTTESSRRKRLFAGRGCIILDLRIRPGKNRAGATRIDTRRAIRTAGL